MALTKITGQVVNTSTDLTVGVLTATTVSVGGTLTYEDVTNVDSVGLITARNGIEVTDKGVQVGTGATVDSAAANTLTFLTGGSERLRVDSSGLVGIKTASPAAPFHVYDATNNTIARLESGDATCRLQVKDSAGEVYVAASGDDLILATTSSVTERLRITSAGKVGINQASPSAPLSFNTGTGQKIELYNSGDDNEFGFGLESSELRICTGSGAFIGFRTGGYAGTERMRLDSSGRLLIGTATPGDSSADDLTISTSGHSGISIKSGTSHAGGIYFGDGTSGSSQYEGIIQYSHSVNALQFYTNYSGSSDTRMTIDSSGRVLIGSTTEGHATADNLTIADSGHCGITLRSGDDDVGTIFFSDGTSGDAEYEGYVQYDHTGNFMKFATNHAETLRIDSSGLITQGGKTASNHGSPNLLLWGADPTLHISATGSSNNSSFAGIKFAVAGGSTGDYSKAGIFVQRQDAYNDLDMIFAFRATNDSAGVAISDEKLRIDSDGRLLIGTTTEGAANEADNLTIAGSDDIGMTIRSTNSSSSRIYFSDGTSGTDEYDGYLIYNHSGRDFRLGTEATERIRIGSLASSVYISHVDSEISVASSSTADTGVTLCGGNTVKYNIFVSNDGVPMYVGRQTSDGTLIHFAQSGNTEGNIVVSGSTVSYNGGHLSRWSQLVGISTNVKSDRPTIYQGTVMSNLDEMCEWPGEVNQQLNKTKVSDSMGDKDVAGVFWAWDDDDDTYTNDFYVAMTGDMVIRIAQGTTVARGDLLMSAGDGTAKPQDDDIVRSKTIAKVTSTTVSATYSDGSYCVPCVLMAC